MDLKMERDYKVIGGMIYIKNKEFNSYYTICDFIDLFIKDDEDITLYLEKHNLSDEVENIIINAYIRIKMEKEFKHKRIKEKLKNAGNRKSFI